MDSLYQYMNWPRMESVVYGEESAPRDVMAPVKTGDGVLVQCFFPQAVSVSVEVSGTKKLYPMKKQDEAGYYAVLLPYKKIPDYAYLVMEEGKKEPCRFLDPYRYPCQLTELDERRYLEGIHYEIYEKLGAHLMTIDGVSGVYFALWAPNAIRVSVVGDFNQWDGRRCPMHRMPGSGIYELFVPGLSEGVLYKYEIKRKGGETSLKGDPFAACVEVPPAGASRVCDLNAYEWKDKNWIKEGRKGRVGTPLSICELDLDVWALKSEKSDYISMAKEIAAYAADMGYTHVELFPVMEHKESPYDTSSYYAPTSRFGSPTDFMAFVDLLHQKGVGVILDWTPAHFPEDSEGLAFFDGTCLYENEDPRRKYHPVWGTLLYNYDSPLVRNFLIGNAFFWMRKYHIDGLRMDDVDVMLYRDYGRADGEWVPNMYGTNENLAAIEFLKHLNSVIKKENADFLLIAQEDGLWPDLTGAVDDTHIGFDYKWNQGWSQDFTEYIQSGFEERMHRHDELTLSMLYAYSENYILNLGSRDVGIARDFLERMPGTVEQKKAGIRIALSYQICHPGAKMHTDLSEAPEFVKKCTADLLKLYRTLPALHALDGEPAGFEWVQVMKYEENIITFLRKTEQAEETLLVVLNFSSREVENYKIGVPYPGKYKEIFNSDAGSYGGGGYTNSRVKMSKKEECDERKNSIQVKVPALGCCIFAYSQVVETFSNNQEAKNKEKPIKPVRQKKGLKHELEQKIQEEKERAEVKK